MKKESLGGEGCCHPEVPGWPSCRVLEPGTRESWEEGAWRASHFLSPCSPQAPAGQRPLPAPGLPEGAPAPGHAWCCPLGQQASEELWSLPVSQPEVKPAHALSPILPGPRHPLPRPQVTCRGGRPQSQLLPTSLGKVLSLPETLLQRKLPLSPIAFVGRFSIFFLSMKQDPGSYTPDSETTLP